MGQLESRSLIGGERQDAIDHCLAGISRLSNEVTDASGFIPAYDQRTYGQVTKAKVPGRLNLLTPIGHQSTHRKASRDSI